MRGAQISPKLSSSNSGCHVCDMKKVPYCELTNRGRHHTIISCPGDLAPRITAKNYFHRPVRKIMRIWEDNYEWTVFVRDAIKREGGL